MADLYSFALQMLDNNPEQANTPLGKQLRSILESRDDAKGQELASNLCHTYGWDANKKIQEGKSMFGL